MPVLWGVHTEVDVMDRLGVLPSAFLGASTWVSMASVQSYILAARVQRLYFLTASCCLVCLASSCYNVCEVVSHLSCDLHFLCICNLWSSVKPTGGVSALNKHVLCLLWNCRNASTPYQDESGCSPFCELFLFVVVDYLLCYRGHLFFLFEVFFFVVVVACMCVCDIQNDQCHEAILIYFSSRNLTASDLHLSL